MTDDTNDPRPRGLRLLTEISGAQASGERLAQVGDLPGEAHAIVEVLREQLDEVHRLARTIVDLSDGS